MFESLDRDRISANIVFIVRFAPSEFYHIYNRGVEGRDIFLDDLDYRRFLDGLLAFNVDHPMTLRKAQKLDITEILSLPRLTSVIGYISMKNHVHFLVKCGSEKNLARFLQKLFIGYTMYFNTKYQRKGVLFQGGSKSKHINEQRYLNHMIDYIHLNSLDYGFPEWREHGIQKTEAAKSALLNYPWSSLNGFLKKEKDFVLDYELIGELFPKPSEILSSALCWSSEIYEENVGFMLEQ